MSNLVGAVVGVGPGNGAAIARRFAEAGYKVAVLARTLDFTSALAEELDGAIAVACDVTSEADVQAAANHLCTQDRSAWSFEAEVRPFGETWQMSEKDRQFVPDDPPWS